MVDTQGNTGQPGEVLANVNGSIRWVKSEQLLDHVENPGSVSTVGSHTVVVFNSSTGSKWFTPSVYTTSIDVLVVGAGGFVSIFDGRPGGGGQVIYHQNTAVTPGTRYLIRVAESGVHLGRKVSSFGNLVAESGSVNQLGATHVGFNGLGGDFNQPGQAAGGAGGFPGGAGSATVYGGGGGAGGPGIFSDITGTSIEYGAGGDASGGTFTQNRGQGGNQTYLNQISRGVVIVRYRTNVSNSPSVGQTND